MPEAQPAELPSLESPLSPETIVDRLDTLAKRGKLAGFQRGTPPTLFEAAAFGTPFDYRLIARGTSVGGGTLLSFVLKLPPKVPIVYAVIVVLSIWPGVWLTDSMLRTYFSWYTLSMWGTCAWYVPLTILPLPWMYKKHFVGSRVAATADAAELIRKIAPEIDARVAP
jgi:hypothetical protein